VLGSASIAAFMSWRVRVEMPSAPAGSAPRGEADVTNVPLFLQEPFAHAMSQSVLLPAFAALFGVLAAIFLIGPRRATGADAGMAVNVSAVAQAHGRHAAR
jgi:hypothetical protein